MIIITGEEVLLSPSRQRPRILLNILCCATQFQSKNVNSAEVEKPDVRPVRCEDSVFIVPWKIIGRF